MRPGRLDLDVSTGAALEQTVQVLRPGAAVRADTVTAGMRVFVDNYPWPVFRVDLSAGWVVLTLGTGLAADPTVTLAAAALVYPAEPAVVTDAVAAYTIEVQPYVDPHDTLRVAIPTTISADGLTVTLSLDADTTADWTDRAGAYSWDMYVLAGGAPWARILEGTLSVTVGDAR